MNFRNTGKFVIFSAACCRIPFEIWDLRVNEIPTQFYGLFQKGFVWACAIALKQERALRQFAPDGANIAEEGFGN